MGKTLDMLLAVLGAAAITHGAYSLVSGHYSDKPKGITIAEQKKDYVDALFSVMEIWGGVFVLDYSLIKLKKQS